MKIDRVNVVDQVLKYLESNLLSGVWQPGQRIDTEISLSKQLNVSRASVHSAIQQLVAVGVLESQQGRGTFVRSISAMEIQGKLKSLSNGVTLRKMMEFRIGLEGEICLGLASTISRRTLQNLYAFIDKLAANREDPEVTKFYDLQFHRALYLATQNELIIQCLNVVCDELEAAHVQFFNPETLELTIQYHKRIADCLAHGDGPGARYNMIYHLATTPCEPPFDTTSLESIESGLFKSNRKP